MRPGTRVVSNTFKMGGWSPDQNIETAIGNTRAYLWIVPAQVDGLWAFREQGGADNFQVQLKQEFQEIEGTVPGGLGRESVQDARLRGADIEFTLVGHDKASLVFKGKVDGDSIRASMQRRARVMSYIGTRLPSKREM